MLPLNNCSTHNPLWQSLRKRQKSKLWSQRWCVWRNSHKFMLLPGNRIIFFWLEGWLLAFSREMQLNFLLMPLWNLWPFSVLAFWSTFFFSHPSFAAGGSTCWTAAKRGNLSTKTDLWNPNIRAFILTPVNAGCESDPEGRLLKSEPSVSFCCSVSRTSCHLVCRALPPLPFKAKVFVFVVAVWPLSEGNTFWF